MSDTRDALAILSLKRETADEICERILDGVTAEHGLKSHFERQVITTAGQVGALRAQYDALLSDFRRVQDLLAAEVGEPEVSADDDTADPGA